jgi:hypothetical protein
VDGRKLQLAGGPTCLVPVPTRWVTDASLKPGDTLFVNSETDASISLRHRPEKRPRARKKTLEEEGEESRDHLLRKLIAVHAAGFALIETHFTPDEGPFVR